MRLPAAGVRVHQFFERSVCVGRSRSVRYCRVAPGASPRRCRRWLWRCRSAGCSRRRRENPPPPSTSRRPTARDRAMPDAALPSSLWWRGFRSKELTDLIEEALTSNLDIAAAVARIVQADAQARIAGAPLLPTIDLSRRHPLARLAATGSSRHGGRAAAPTHDLQRVAQRELRDRLLGQEPRAAARRRGDRGGEPLRPRSGGAHHGRHRRQCLFPGAGRAATGCASRATISPPPRACSS